MEEEEESKLGVGEKKTPTAWLAWLAWLTDIFLFDPVFCLFPPKGLNKTVERSIQ